MAAEVARRSGAEAFAREWQGRGYEKGETQPFWLQLLRDVCGAKRPESLISFEQGVKLAHAAFIDAVIPSTHVLIEQKGRGHDLMKPQRQSDGAMLTPYEQARRYANELPYSQRPRWIVVCNFAEFHIHDMEKAGGQPLVLPLEELPTSFHLLDFLVDEGAGDLWRQKAVSVEAGEIVGRLHALLQTQYLEPDSPRAQKSLNVLCVRLVFCLYAEDTGLFGKKGMFCEYLSAFSAGQMRRALIDLFAALDTPLDQRDPYLDPALAAFPYVNGGLFAEADIEIPLFTEELRGLLLQRSSREFDWSVISPTIFGALFESTLNPETRRSGGMHYTSIENIHKVIDPLFLDGLKARLTEAKAAKSLRARSQKLRELWNDMAALSFLDPAAGSGNFLTESYLCLRRLENEIIRELHGEQGWLDGTRPVNVSIRNFYGIEINDFAVAVARTALWIAESQMLLETERIVGRELDFLPLKTSAHIAEGNALRMDWNEVVPAERLNYIMGNPPFVGYTYQSAEQKADMQSIWTDERGRPYRMAGKMDYVSCWYCKAAQFMQGTGIRAAFVSTNSITQGEQAAAVWKPLITCFGVRLDFARLSFVWDSEASGKAHVHCVIIGFSCGGEDSGAKRIFSGEEVSEARNISPYLVDAPTVFTESRAKAICSVPPMVYGNKPADGGFLMLTPEEKKTLLAREPKAEKFIRRLLGSAEYINNKERWCLWLKHASPAELRLPAIRERVEAVRQFRLASPKEATRRDADTAWLFQEDRQPEKGEFIIVPRVSSENRLYVPIGFVSSKIVVNDSVQIIPNATLYHFGVLTSSAHMAWMRTVCGRLKSDYRYSKDIVYNNFPWPEETEAHRAAIEKTAQGILDARALYPESSLADLYDTAAMPPELRRAHRANDKAVLAAYGLAPDMAEADIVAALMARYQALAAL